MLSLSRLFHHARHPLTHLAPLALAALPASVLAALPQQQAPTRGEGSNWMQTMQNFIYDGAMLIGVGLCGFALFIVGRHSIGIYHDIHLGKAKWADLGGTVAVGVTLLGAIVFLVTQATKIF